MSRPTAPWPRILPVMSWSGLTALSSTSITRLDFSSMVDIIRCWPEVIVADPDEHHEDHRDHLLQGSRSPSPSAASPRRRPATLAVMSAAGAASGPAPVSRVEVRREPRARGRPPGRVRAR